MKRRPAVTLLTVAFSIGISSVLPARATSIQPGDPGVYHYGGSLYKIVSGPTWYDAEANAQALGGYLTSITTPEEDAFLYNNIVLAEPEASYGRFLWVGLNDVDNEGVYKWSSGEPFSYNNINKLINGIDPPDPQLQAIELHQDWVLYWAPNGTWDTQEVDGYPYTGFGRRGIAEVPYAVSASAPGPLPVFGAVAAFGYSRKLRKRMRSPYANNSVN